MKEIQIEELRDLQMQILDYVDAFCRKHDIHYTISGGTLLGAVRHGGFIPWDDDIDIQMLRSEYEKFTSIWNQHKNEHGYFELVNIESGNSMGYPFGKIHDTRTITYLKDFARTGVFIDVFPVDNVIDYADFVHRHCEVKKMYKKRNNALNFIINKKSKNLKSILLAYLNKPTKSLKSIAVIINNLAQIKNNKDCLFVFEMISGLLCKEPIPKEVFGSYSDIVFEDRTYMSVSDYHTYLSRTFGDYMKLPPEEKRVAKHGFVPYWK